MVKTMTICVRIKPVTSANEDPDGGGPITGKDVVMESARQLCIYEETAIPDPDHPKTGDRRRSWKWWEYVTQHLDECPLHSDDIN